jgi:hypothetical protein
MSKTVQELRDENKQQVRTQLLKQHKAYMEALWAIHAESDNSDWHGYHPQKFLVAVQGTYLDAVEYALTLPSFFTYGAGGSVRPLGEVINLATLKSQKVQDLKARLQYLKSQEVSVQTEIEAIHKELQDSK